ncbi:hypothetical protein GV828_05865 [Flavobacterium sp. NST-5]|uniref:Uncharacterized protein n=1 Tax=Flavobacterium ichthyis TaxID=2698827 RepID=A0ABW9ZCA2_9FLAO|nr:hypothetical protein [Flavobacterium ichthyis]NBL64725.1 hypothetical protein [Flavobacterium ichthyis]
MKKTIFLIFLFLIKISVAQEKMLVGKVNAFGNLEGINVVNLVNEKSAITNAVGEFQILAKEDDLIILSSLDLEYKRKIISESEFKLGKFVVEMVAKPQQIDEVTITEYRIDAVKAGILSKPARQYTPAERRLYTATTGGGILPIDAIINLITGRTKMLVKEVEIEKREMAREQINNWFDDQYLMKTYNISEEKIEAFKFYVVENDELRTHLKSKNKERTKLLLTKLSIDYLKLNSEQ